MPTYPGIKAQPGVADTETIPITYRYCHRYTRKVYTNLIFPISASSHVIYFAPPSNFNILYIPMFKQKNIFFELILDNG